MHRIALLAACTLLLTAPLIAIAGWSGDPMGGVLVGGGTNTQQLTSAPDPTGGVLFVWIDSRTGSPDVYAQKVDSCGVVQWTVGGVTVCATPNAESQPVIYPDGAGGAYVCWNSAVTGTEELRAQRIQANGTAAWNTPCGVLVSSVPGGYPFWLDMTSFPSGPVLVWTDQRGADHDIYMQALDASSGAAVYTANGEPVCTWPGFQDGSKIIAVNATDCFMVWDDPRGSPYAQRLQDGSAFFEWEDDGVPVDSVITGGAPVLTSAGDGTACITWATPHPTTFASHLYTARLQSDGTPSWFQAVGVTSDSTSLHAFFDAAPRGDGGVSVLWYNLTSDQVRIQTITGAGFPQWGSTGQTVTGSGARINTSRPLALAQLGVGGDVVGCWSDTLDGFSNEENIRAQRFDSGGIAQWVWGGLLVNNAPRHQLQPVIESDSQGGVTIGWLDGRADTYPFTNAVYAQGLGLLGLPGTVSVPGDTSPILPRALPGTPNPARTASVVRFWIPEAERLDVTVYDVTGATVHRLSDQPWNAGWNDLRFDVSGWGTGVYFYRIGGGPDAPHGRLVVVR